MYVGNPSEREYIDVVDHDGNSWRVERHNLEFLRDTHGWFENITQSKRSDETTSRVFYWST